MTIHAPDSVRARNLRLQAARVITTMTRGATLQLTYTKHGSDFHLSDGTRVPPEVALAVVNDTRIRSVDKGLFPGTPQTWRCAEL
jgi:hypothetical protein